MFPCIVDIVYYLQDYQHLNNLNCVDICMHTYINTRTHTPVNTHIAVNVHTFVNISRFRLTESQDDTM